MFYTEYKEAAERHLEVCLQLEYLLRDNYKAKEDAGQILSSRERKEKLQLLSDLYYLSGYIIECSYNCAIYHQIGWTRRVDRLRTSSTSHLVSCFPDTGARFIIRRSGHGIRQHQLSGNMHFFQTIIPITAISSIPLIGYSLSTTRACYDLFDEWNAEVRYTIDSSLNLDYDNVFDFLSLALEIIEGLKTNSMI